MPFFGVEYAHFFFAKGHGWSISSGAKESFGDELQHLLFVL
jgi:hypothetical protein